MVGSVSIIPGVGFIRPSSLRSSSTGMGIVGLSGYTWSREKYKQLIVVKGTESEDGIY